MGNPFEIAGGCIPGYMHTDKGWNNHDAFCWNASPNGIIAVVCDGCGAGSHVEVGSKIGVRMVVNVLQKQLERGFLDLAQFQMEVLSQLHILATWMGGDLREVVSEYFLFTIVGTVITSEKTYVFTLGDGVNIVNGKEKRVDVSNVVRDRGGKSVMNAPPYLGYLLVGFKPEDHDIKFIIDEYDTKDVETLLLGTDGMFYFMDGADAPLPGKKEKLGPVSQFWEDDKYFSNSQAITRRLRLANRDHSKIDYEKRMTEKSQRILYDDTALIVIRRKKDENPTESKKG